MQTPTEHGQSWSQAARENTMSLPSIKPDTLLTSHQVGSLLQVNPSSINKWVKEGRLPAFRTPGGHRRIRAGDVVTFLHKHQIPVPGTLSSAARRRLLVIDDDAKQLQSVQRMLKQYSNQVELTTVDNGIEALVLIGSLKPHLVVLDVYMPGLDGLEVCRRLKSRIDTSSIRIVIASGQMTPDLERRARNAGAARCLPKPVSADLIMQELGVTAENDVLIAGV